MTEVVQEQLRYVEDNRALISRELQRRGSYMLRRYFPDCTPTCRKLRGGFISRNKVHHRDVEGRQLYCRVLYPKHIALMDASAIHRETGMIAGNRVGKSDIGAFSTTCHMTGLYPHWWRGRRFDEPVACWAAGDTGKTTRNIIQKKLLGPASAIGTGFIPAHLIVAKTKKSGIADAYEMLWIRHVPTGKVSTIELKSYDQRRESFQGTAQHIIWLDEEPPMDIYAECLLRTTKTSDFPGGMILLTFTPLQGRTVLVKQFLADAVRLDAEEAA